MVLGNRISDLSYQGPIITSAIGVIVVGGPIYNGNPTSGCLPSGCDYPVGVHIEGNLIANADIGVVILAADEDFSPAPDPTGNVVARNLIRNVALSNVNGWDTGVAYQAGISDYANGDHIVDNVILGRGYHADFCGDARLPRRLVAEAVGNACARGQHLHVRDARLHRHRRSQIGRARERGRGCDPVDADPDAHHVVARARTRDRAGRCCTRARRRWADAGP